MSCPEHEVLLALGDGELGESRARAVRAHTESCTRCKADLDALGSLAADLRAPLPGALRGRTAEAFADDVLANIDRPRARPSRLPRWIGWLAAAAALPLAAGLAFRSLHSAHDANEFAARGSSSVAALQHTLVQFGRVTGTTFEPLAEGARLEADAVIAAEVGGTEGPPRYLLAFLVDSAGERHWIYPAYEPGAPPPSALALPVTAAPRVLGSMVRLDRPASGPARLVAVVLPRSESVEHVEHVSLDQLDRDRLAAHYGGALVVSIRVEIL
jgi:hypothetical protein